ncbi:hypothetical protein B0A50_02534 [Salinomyces thailandicus]|uniref:Uncharacterized protein n=1 Tax=Salinomyces thailandicus TaxID=706561 RepID=A0A4U0U732_9PEZI|nr:hypothetical protein B0A50_02534 [Salinomyces thailandica]
MSSSSSSSSKSKTSYTRPEGFDRAQDITNDLEEYGCSIEHVKKALAMKDQPIDALAQMPRRTLKAAEEPPGEIVTVARGDRVGRGNANAKSAYEHLYLREGTNWVLFDPLRRYPRSSAACPPPFLHRWERYEPGKPRILEYNVATHCVRLRSTPAILQGRQVAYKKTGPKLEDVKKKGGRKGKALISAEIVDSQEEEEGPE